MGEPVSVLWIRDTDSLNAQIERLDGGPLCVDSEADSLHHYPEKVCLIQLTHSRTDLLIDTLGGLDLAPLAPLLSDPGLPKILHGADYDLRLLHRDFGLEIRGLFDTMLAARLVGERAFGLAALLEKYLGVQLDKKYQRADWSRRPLPKEMELYAAMDTRYLEALADELTRRLRRLGREGWAAEEFERLEQVRWTGGDDGEAFRRIKGSRTLGRRGLGLLRELHGVRERAAVERDRPPFMILRNECLIALARLKAPCRDGVSGVAGLPQRWSRGSGLRLLLEAIERGFSLPEDELPETLRPTRRRRSPSFEASFKELRRRRDEVAQALDLEPSVLASRGHLEQAVERLESDRSPSEVPDLLHWQREQLREVLEKPIR